MIDDRLKDVDEELAYTNLCDAFTVKNGRALALAMGLSPSAVTNARQRQSLPWEGIIRACKKSGISIDEIFEIEVTTHINKVHREKPDVPPPLAVDDLIAANALVDKVLDDEFFNKNLSAERELLISKKLRPVLIKAVFQYNFNEIFVKTIAQGALVMA